MEKNNREMKKSPKNLLRPILAKTQKVHKQLYLLEEFTKHKIPETQIGHAVHIKEQIVFKSYASIQANLLGL